MSDVELVDGLERVPEQQERDDDLPDEGFPPRLLRTIEELIEGYLASDVTGGSAGASSFGAMIARIELYGFRSVPCPRCGIPQNPFPGFAADGTDCRRCKGIGSVPDKAAQWPSRNLVHEKCTPCKGTGKIQLLGQLAALYDEPPTCSRCDGDGFVTPITANKGQGVRREASYSMDDAEAERDGVISRVLAELAEDEPDADLAARLYLGTIGAHWSTREEFGRVFALWPMTVPGAKLVAASRRRDRSEHWASIDDHHVLATEVNEAKATPNDMRRALIAQARNAAALLWESSLIALWRADVATGGRLEVYARNRVKAEERART